MNTPRCHCGAALIFTHYIDKKTDAFACRCWCERCRARAEKDGAALDVDGSGSTMAEAIANRAHNLESF